MTFRNIIGAVVTVGTSQVEAKVGGSRLDGRGHLYVENVGLTTLYVGPTGVASSGSSLGASLVPGQYYSEDVGDVGIFVISSASGGSMVVQEYST